MGGALKLGIIPKKLLLEADRQGYNYSKNDYHFILSSFHREVIIQSSGATAKKGYCMSHLVSMVVTVLVNQF